MRLTKTEVEANLAISKVTANGEFKPGVYLSNYCADFGLEQAVLEWADLIDEEEDTNLTITFLVRDIFKETYESNRYDNGNVGEDDMYLFNALRKDCEWIIKQIDELRVDKGE